MNLYHRTRRTPAERQQADWSLALAIVFGPLMICWIMGVAYLPFMLLGWTGDGELKWNVWYVVGSVISWALLWVMVVAWWTELRDGTI